MPRHGLKEAGGGVERGLIVKNTNTLASFGYSDTYEFNSDLWTWRVGGVQKNERLVSA